MNTPKLHQQNGFTIIELLIASTVFAIVLMLVTFGILQISRTYYKGVTSAQTQQTARSVMDQVAQAIQFSGTTPNGTPASPPTPGTAAAFCLNGTRYTYVLGRQLNDNPVGAKSQAAHVLVSDTSASCTPADLSNLGLLSNPRELMSPNMRLAKLQVTSVGNNLYNVVIRVVYGDDDLLCSPALNDCTNTATNNYTTTVPADLGCKNIPSGTQFCAASELNTTVQKRLN